jgi:hypothetical protein
MKYKIHSLPSFAMCQEVVEAVVEVVMEEVVEEVGVYHLLAHHRPQDKMCLLPEVKLRQWDNSHKSFQEIEAKLMTSSMNSMAIYD